MSASLRRTVPVLLVGILALSGCYREITDATAASRSRYVGADPWTVDGLRLGVTLEEVRVRLGEPDRVHEYNGEKSTQWRGGQLLVHFDRTGRATEISGQSIRAGDRTLVSVGDAEAELEQVFGPGKTAKSRRPRGSGVISIGSEHTHTQHTYENGGGRFEVSVAFPAGTVANIWLRAPGSGAPR